MECREKLIRLRKKQGLTQLELAEAVDVSRQAISKWEVGAAIPSIENLRSLSIFYGVPVDLLLNDELDLPDTKQVLPKEPSQQSEAPPAEESPLSNEIKKEISSLKKCMSFHPEPGFETLTFKDHGSMWSKVHEFVDQGYVVQ